MKARYLHPFTSFGFHRLFLQDSSQQLLLDFLNSLPVFGSSPLQQLLRVSKEALPLHATATETVTHFCALNQIGEPVIIAIQKAQLNFFRNLTGFFNDFPLWEKPIVPLLISEKQINHIYCIGILDFVFTENSYKPEYIYEKTLFLEIESLPTSAHKLPYTFCWLELPKFHIDEQDLSSKLDSWLYLLKHLESITEIPRALQTPLFQRVFELTDHNALNKDEAWAYEMSLKVFRDWNNIYESAYEQAFKQAQREKYQELLNQEGQYKERLSKKEPAVLDKTEDKS